MARSAQIQGLRALAVLLVLFYHADWIPGGYIGVDIFYVISGFLITSLILKSENFSFSEFYARRAKRLLPAAYLVLLVTALIFWAIAPSIARSQFAKELLASIWYLSNYFFAHLQNDYQNLGAQPSPLIHYWSLAVEEQFYLIWPLLILIFRRKLKIAVVLLSLISLLLSLWLIGRSPIWAFYSLPTRAFELGIGAILAVFGLSFKGRNAQIFSWVALLVICSSALVFDNSTPFPTLPALVPTLAGALLIVNTYQNPVLTLLPFQKLGDWSYSIYLWHWPLLILPTIYLDRPLSLFEKIFLLVLCILISSFTYRFVEHPIRTMKLPVKSVFRATLIAGSFLSALSLVMLVSGNQAASAFNLAEVRKLPVIYNDGCQLDKRVTKPDISCVYGDKKAKRNIVLLGDSHAAQWFPTIDRWAKSRKYQLIVMTKSSCPASALSLKDEGGFKASLCNEFRVNALEKIKKLDTSLLIVGSAENHKYVPPSDYLKLPRDVKRLLVLKDTPWPNRDIPECIASKRYDGKNCQISIPKAIDFPGFDTFDPVPLLCDSKGCPAVIDGIVAYRDHSHISVAMAQHLYDALAEKLDKLVAR